MTRSMFLVGCAALLVAGSARAHIVEVIPSEGYPGEELTIDVVGSGVSYSAGCWVAFDPHDDIEVLWSYVAQDLGDSRMRANIRIDRWAQPGYLDVLVDCRNFTDRGRSAFEILGGTPALVDLEPDTIRQGRSAQVTLIGSDTHFGYDSQVSVSGAGVTAGVLAVIDDTELHVTLQAAGDAPTGFRNVTVTTADEEVTGSELLEVIAKPTVLRVEPGTVAQGETCDVVLVGKGTNFADGDPVTVSGTGVTLTGPSERISKVRLRVALEVDPRCPTGPRTVSVTSDGDVFVGEDFLEVAARLGLTPEGLTQGTSESVVAVGGDGWFTTDLTVDVGSRVAIQGVTVFDGYSVGFDATAEPNAVVGPRTVTFEHGGAEVTGTLVVRLNPETTTLDSVDPSSADAGVVDLPVTVQGTNTNFAGHSRYRDPSDLVLSSGAVTASSETEARGALSVADDATPGPLGFIVSTGYEHVTLDPGFTVTAPARVTAVTPDLLDPGASHTVRVTATDGQFADGSSQVYVSGEGITVGSARVRDPETLEVDLDVAADASGEARTLKVVTGARAALGGVVDVFQPALSADVGALWVGLDTEVQLTAVDIDLTDDLDVAFDVAGIEARDLATVDPEHASFTAVVAADVTARTTTLTVTAGGRSLTLELSVRTRSSGDDGGGGGCGCGAGAADGGGGWLLLGWLALHVRPRRGAAR